MQWGDYTNSTYLPAFFRTYLPWFPPKYVKSQVIFVVGRVFSLFTIVSGNVQCYKAVGQWAINRNIQIDPQMWTLRAQSLYDAMYKSLCTCMFWSRLACSWVPCDSGQSWIICLPDIFSERSAAGKPCDANVTFLFYLADFFVVTHVMWWCPSAAIESQIGAIRTFPPHLAAGPEMGEDRRENFLCLLNFRKEKGGKWK